MAAPWIGTTKTIGVTDSAGTAPTRTLSTAFIPPAVPATLCVPPSVLFAAIARMQALRSASPAVTAALLRAATALTEAVFDDVGSGFDLLAEVEMIEQTARTALAGAIGAGICDLFMVLMGYTWHDHANRVVTGSPLADFVYEGGAASGHGIVLAEAKGSFAKHVDSKSVRVSCEAAYARQVGPYVGQSTVAGTVVHGYAVKVGCQLVSVRTPPPPYAFVHVTQTPTGAHPWSSSSSVPSAPSGNPSTTIALGNYRAAFMLAGAPSVVDVIDAYRDGAAPEYREQFFDVLETPRGPFVAGPMAGAAAWPYSDMQVPGRRFAVRQDIAETFLDRLSGLVTNRSRPERLELPIVPTPFGFETEHVFPDGFSLVRDSDAADILGWSSTRGVMR